MYRNQPLLNRGTIMADIKVIASRSIGNRIYYDPY